MKLFIMQFSPTSRHFISLQSQYQQLRRVQIFEYLIWIFCSPNVCCHKLLCALCNFIYIRSLILISSRYSDGLWAGRTGFHSRQEQHILLYSAASRQTLGPNQPPIQWVPETISPRVKRQRRDAHHSPPSSAEVKNDGAIPPFSHMSSWRSA
jgi:hypothetical protein